MATSSPPGSTGTAPLTVASRVTFTALPGIGRIGQGDDLAQVIADALLRTELTLEHHDVLCITSKALSLTEGRRVCLEDVQPTARAVALARQTGKDPRLVELVLRESTHISRVQPGVLIVRHRLGFICTNAGIDQSNVGAEGQTKSSVLLLPADPDGSAQALRATLKARFGVELGVIITDSHSRAFRAGTVGVAIGCAGIAPIYDQRGRADLAGRPLEHTVTATADQLAACADLVAGQADEGRPMVLVRGVRFAPSSEAAVALYRKPEQDLYA